MFYVVFNEGIIIGWKRVATLVFVERGRESSDVNALFHTSQLCLNCNRPTSSQSQIV